LFSNVNVYASSYGDYIDILEELRAEIEALKEEILKFTKKNERE